MQSWLIGYNVSMKAVLFGTGWRAMFYVRIARALPELLEIVSVCTRKEERAELMRKEGLAAFTDPEKALAVPHDITLAVSGKEGFYPLMCRLKERSEFVLTETSFLPLSDKELDDLSGMKGAVAEQYRFTPLYASAIAAMDMVGEIDQLYLSGLHNHHAASIARTVLGLGSRMPDEIRTLDFPSSIRKTGSKEGMIVNGTAEDYTRKLRLLRFGEKLFIQDFSTNQYHSYFYGRSFEIRGRYGIINEREVRCLGPDGYPCILPFAFHRDWTTGNGSLTLSHATLGERTVFVNPFYPAELNDDEIAIADIIRRIDAGEDYPEIISGVEDARLGRLL